MEIADDLRDCPFDAKKLVGEEIINLDWLILVQTLGARIVRIVDVARALGDDHVVDARVRKLRHQGIGLDDLKIFEQSPSPLLGLARCTIAFDYLLETARFRHQLTPWLGLVGRAFYRR